MSLSFLRSFYAIVLKFLRRLLHGRRWWVVATVPVVIFFGIFFAAQNYEAFYRRLVWDDYLFKIQNPLANMADHYAHDSHSAKLTFRLVVPLVGHLLGLGKNGILVWMQISGVILVAGAMLLVWRDTRDRYTALFAGLFFVSTNAGMLAFTPYFPYIDGIYISFLMLALLARHPALVWLACFTAAWCDERALITTPLVMIYHAYRLLPAAAPGETFWPGLRRQALAFFNPACLAIIASWLSYGALRLYLAKAYHLYTVTETFAVSEKLKGVLFFALWTALEGGWFLLLLAVVALWLRRDWLFIPAMGSSMAVLLAASVLVRDLSKSLTYLYPLAFIAILVLSRTEGRAQLRRLVFGAFFLSWVMGNYHVWTTLEPAESIYWVYPLPLYLKP